MSVKPSNLPRLRRQTLQHLRDPESALRSGAGKSNSAGLSALATAVEAADLYWASQDMAALAMHSGGQLAAARWATADRPAPCGLLFWQDGIGHIDAQGVQVPVEACAWGPFEGGMLLWLLMSRARLSVEVGRIGRYQLVEEQIPPLIPVCGAVLPVTDEPVSFAELGQELPQPIVAALAAAWLVMQQPLLIDRTRERADKPTARAYARDGLPTPDVTVVDLRRQYTPQNQDPDADGTGRHYRHRWVVSGHWRNQAHGPGQSLRRQTWVPAHMKGPDGAPLLSTEKVNVWRR
ncbi:hypothetical protein [Streptomyces poriferorum]|uniref:Uncharacterized protein n=1 Tax=Streptomyces poriferorum TaxID=2798799 RepID=A0ABY9IY39_9ACTN|nr:MULTISPECIES: hypothetical protein [unclassified Streptomyces]MDP5310436.1 hypothetical protein [Streptomyces sp. Alt4]WLQ60410.1 hypothetical protein P8A19_35525 [Streptomyces sp. Alt2]